jgi:hypothetical protein
VRVVGGCTEHQFAERRLPTIDELNAVAPDTPVFILHLYDRAVLNAAALRAVGYTKDTPEPPGGEIVRDAKGNPTGLLLAKPNANILYATLAKGPKLPFEYQVNSTRHFMRELNRLGVTGAIDAGGGFQNYPEDYAVIQKLSDEGQLTIRLAYNLFTQKPKAEKEDFLNWTRTSKYKQGTDYLRHNGAGWCSRQLTLRIFACRARTCRPKHLREARESRRVLLFRKRILGVEFPRAINDAPADYRELACDGGDFACGAGEEVPVRDDQIGELPNFDTAFLALFIGEPGDVLRPHAKHGLPVQAIALRVKTEPAQRSYR